MPSHFSVNFQCHEPRQIDNKARRLYLDRCIPRQRARNSGLLGAALSCEDVMGFVKCCSIRTTFGRLIHVAKALLQPKWQAPLCMASMDYMGLAAPRQKRHQIRTWQPQVSQEDHLNGYYNDTNSRLHLPAMPGQRFSLRLTSKEPGSAELVQPQAAHLV